MDNNPFDQLGEPPKFSDEDNAKFDHLDYLIHKTFAQTDSGIELLEAWKETLMFFPTAEQGADLLEVGLREGRKSFIRDILLTIKKVEQ